MSAINFVKQRLERPETIGLIMHDKPAKDVMASWQIFPHREFVDFKIPEKATPRPREVLEELWIRNTFTDFEKLSKSVALSVGMTESLFERLRINCLIWPDGTIPAQAQKLLIADQAAYLNERAPRWKAPR